MQSRPETGRHSIHLDQGLICENCHTGYLLNLNHKNGTIDGSARDGFGIVFFDSLNTAALWNVGTRDCSSVECHGGGAQPINWYDGSGDCTACHSAGSRVDPLTTNGQGIRGKHAAHVTGAKIGCVDCHNGYKEKSTHMNGLYGKAEPDSIMNFAGMFHGSPVSSSFNDDTGLCASTSCHGGGGEINWYSDGSGCTACHAPGSWIDPLTTNGTGDRGKHIAHVTKKGIECTVCHTDYNKKPNHGNGVYGKLETDPIVYYDSSNPSASWDNGGKVCSGMNCHGSVGWYATGAIDCAICHAPGSTYDPLTINGTGLYGKHVKHVSERGMACTKCHYGYTGLTTHANGVLDTMDPATGITFFDATNPSGTWSGDTGPRTGGCASLSCHGPSALGWYGTDSWVLPDCSVCHRNAIGGRRQVFDTNGDGTGSGGDFNLPSHHVINYNARTNQIITTADCVMCHDMGVHMGGAVRLKHKDNSGQVVVYDPAQSSSLEPFCLSCHDSNGASVEPGKEFQPFTDPNTLGVIPNTAGITIKDNWVKTSSHKVQGLTCMGNGQPGTGCHGNNGAINGHGSNNYGLLSRTMNFQINAPSAYNANDYDLCFDCHYYYPGKRKEDILGVRQGGGYDYNHGIYTRSGSIPFGYPPYYIDSVISHFIDSDGRGMDTTKYVRKNQLHWYHLGIRLHSSGTNVASGWLYRGVGSVNDGCTTCHPIHSANIIGMKITCISCHSVHGSNTSYGMVYDEFNITHDADETAGHMGMYRSNMVNAPVFCGATLCHCGYSGSGTDHRFYNFNPSNE